MKSDIFMIPRSLSNFQRSVFFLLADCIDCGNYKKAIHEADKVLKKQSDFTTCKVLKALALVRSGRELEAGPILEGVLAEAPTDEHTLQAMTFAYRDMHQRKFSLLRSEVQQNM